MNIWRCWWRFLQHYTIVLSSPEGFPCTQFSYTLVSVPRPLSMPSGPDWLQIRKEMPWDREHSSAHPAYWINMEKNHVHWQRWAKSWKKDNGVHWSKKSIFSTDLWELGELSLVRKYQISYFKLHFSLPRCQWTVEDQVDAGFGQPEFRVPQSYQNEPEIWELLGVGTASWHEGLPDPGQEAEIRIYWSDRWALTTWGKLIGGCAVTLSSGNVIVLLNVFMV